MNYELERLPMAPYTDFSASRYVSPEHKEQIANATDIILIRPPFRVTDDQIAMLAEQLTALQFEPVILPNFAQAGGEVIDTSRFFPTDRVRTIGPWIIHSLFSNLAYLTDAVPEKYVNPLRQLEVSVYFRGGDFIYSTQHSVFIYTENHIFNSYNNQLTLDRKALQLLQSSGWNCVPIQFPDELDFTQALFTGKDQKLHTIIAQGFASNLIPKEEQYVQMIVHTIPNSEWRKGGCNIADCRNGSVLILPNHSDAPTTHTIIEEFADPKISILESPPGFYEYTSGPRCAISDIPLVG